MRCEAVGVHGSRRILGIAHAAQGNNVSSELYNISLKPDLNNNHHHGLVCEHQPLGLSDRKPT